MPVSFDSFVRAKAELKTGALQPRGVRGKERGFLVNVILVIFGMFLAPAAGSVIAVPTFLPLARAMHIDLVQLALILVFNLNMGPLTPPVCITLSMSSDFAGVPFERSVKEVTPYLRV
jgi:TRAP-type C4-dicarboxylate transport system permease large subunit